MFWFAHIRPKTGRKKLTKDFTHKELANHIYGLITQNVVPINNWGVYLTNSDFDDEQELRNKIGAVWLGGLYDTIEQQERLVPRLRKRAKDLGLEHFNDVLDLAEAVMEVTKDILAMYSIEEQIFILDFRNQLVHAWLDNRLRRKVSVKYFSAGSIKKERISHERFASIIRPFYEEGIDKPMGELIERFRTRPVRYWGAIQQIREPSNDAKLRQIVYSGLDGNPPLSPGDYSLNINL